MNKREFIKRSAILGAGTLIAPTIASSCMTSAAQAGATASLVAQSEDGAFLQPELAYAFDALEPHVDAMTMEFHYGKHHAGYTKKFNAALEHADFHSTDIYKIFSTVSTLLMPFIANAFTLEVCNFHGRLILPSGAIKRTSKSLTIAATLLLLIPD